ncbi:hypothetical protein E6H18_01625 [Candidatus Bathyarchaeota archaeon]|nr:MAG: hypothetical protein E6H20_03895 [Candidatus Bathyarchaeota archaeon]TMI58809.1 MAG: hypothetical protein E6H18_01625 [Candidatus Bathyarchaeota archaeon]
MDLPYAFDRVWDAAISVLQEAKWNVTKADKAKGGIEVHVVMDMITWTETLFVNVTRNNDNSTRVIMGRVGLAQPVDWGISRQYVESFLNKLETVLKSTSQN